MPTIGVAPGPNYYAVIRMDPISMVMDLGLDDPITLAEAKQMVTKRYLVYLHWPFELYMPDMRWCRYDAEIIGTTLRPSDENSGITSDMVIPIAPNKNYTGERRPVHPHPSFPFSNCYHWFRNHIKIRVRTREGGFDHDGGFMLPGAEHLALNHGFSQDRKRLAAFRVAKDELSAAATPAMTVPAEGGSSAKLAPKRQDSMNSARSALGALAEGEPSIRPDVLAETYLRLVTARGLKTSDPPSEIGSELNADGSDMVTSASTMSSLAGMDLFGWDPDPSAALIPLVDAWLDVGQYLSEDDIPNPLELREEVVKIHSYVGVISHILQS
ncbi:hypothetical protein OH76DRAFT_1351949 [Lentinus brumalis]|uniref:Uncharacterized protein n=1 Tax=Lentinus brumalis TaxID=2498619 RepID=A0A371D838_9APHY|nr:hypothetical protein OH76DRAFT_1351949 [Polyporus brumalis]